MPLHCPTMSATPATTVSTAAASGDDAADVLRCAACGTPRTGPYCAGCGQKHADASLSLRHLARKGVQHVFDVERGFLHTFLRLFRHPGHVARDYVDGIRSPYVNPLAYFFIAAALQVVALVFTEDLLAAMITDQFTSNPEMQAVYAEMLGDNAAQRYTAIMVSVLKQTYSYLFLVALILPAAAGLYWLSPDPERSFTVAETAVFLLYTLGHTVLLTALLAPVLIHVHPFAHSAVGLLSHGAFLLFAARQFFGPTLRTVVLTALSFAAAFLLYVVGMVVVFMLRLLYEVGAFGALMDNIGL